MNQFVFCVQQKLNKKFSQSINQAFIEVMYTMEKGVLVRALLSADNNLSLMPHNLVQFSLFMMNKQESAGLYQYCQDHRTVQKQSCPNM
jgi:hypothetical protein